VPTAGSGTLTKASGDITSTCRAPGSPAEAYYPDGTPAEPISLTRIEGTTAPASVTVQVRSVQRRGTAVPGSGQTFTVLFF